MLLGGQKQPGRTLRRAKRVIRLAAAFQRLGRVVCGLDGVAVWNAGKFVVLRYRCGATREAITGADAATALLFASGDLKMEHRFSIGGRQDTWIFESHQWYGILSHRPDIPRRSHGVVEDVRLLRECHEEPSRRLGWGSERTGFKELKVIQADVDLIPNPRHVTICLGESKALRLAVTIIQYSCVLVFLPVRLNISQK